MGAESFDAWNSRVPGPRPSFTITRMNANRLTQRMPRSRQNAASANPASPPENDAARVRQLYDGPAGGWLAIGSLASLHQPLLGRLMRRGDIELGRFRRVLDVGTGAGQILKHLLRLTSPDASITACDLSHRMLHRARIAARPWLKSASTRVRFLNADLNRLPFADGEFDLVTCGYVLEHLADPRQGLGELHRVLSPGGSLLLAATEDTFAGQMCGRLWGCRSLNRDELREACAQSGLPWTRQLWFSRSHKLLKLGGILVEARKTEA